MGQTAVQPNAEQNNKPSAPGAAPVPVLPAVQPQEKQLEKQQEQKLPARPADLLSMTPDKQKAISAFMQEYQTFMQLSKWNASDNDIQVRTGTRIKGEILSKLAKIAGVTPDMSVDAAVSESRGGLEVLLRQNTKDQRISHYFTISNAPVQGDSKEALAADLSKRKVDYRRAEGKPSTSPDMRSATGDFISAYEPELAQWSTRLSSEKKATVLTNLKTMLNIPESTKCDLKVEPGEGGATLKLSSGGKELLSVTQPWATETQKYPKPTDFKFDPSMSLSPERYAYYGSPLSSGEMRVNRPNEPFYSATPASGVQRVPAPFDLRVEGVHLTELKDFGVTFDSKRGEFDSHWQKDDGSSVSLEIPSRSDHVVISRDSATKGLRIRAYDSADKVIEEHRISVKGLAE